MSGEKLRSTDVAEHQETWSALRPVMCSGEPNGPPARPARNAPRRVPPAVHAIAALCPAPRPEAADPLLANFLSKRRIPVYKRRTRSASAPPSVTRRTQLRLKRWQRGERLHLARKDPTMPELRGLFLSTPHKSGADVKQLQLALNKRLKARGFAQIEADGDYGADTASAVRRGGDPLGAPGGTPPGGGPGGP